MRQINYKLLNGGYYALMIDGEEIGVVYKQEHAAMIEQATIQMPVLTAKVNDLDTQLEERIHELRKRNQGPV